MFDTLYAEGQRRYVETFPPVRTSMMPSGWPLPVGSMISRSGRASSIRVLMAVVFPTPRKPADGRGQTTVFNRRAGQ
ncbi:MAG: hypothetical protein KDE64_14570, partial [Rhodocyclaceae bacterium]|nr:hypothetical protein [Rhodocyclaceae bacterium]